MNGPTVLWWGRFDAGYSRNRILKTAFESLGWRQMAFRPRTRLFGDWEAWWARVARPDLVFVPCFRQRDVASAHRYARRHGVPLLFDPLISAWDKQVFERRKFPEQSARAEKLLAAERRVIGVCDAVLADTTSHARFFQETLGVSAGRVHVVHVGAERPLFSPTPMKVRAHDEITEVLFYGSFLGLHGPETIIKAAKRYEGPPVRWHLIGEGPYLDRCRKAAIGLANVVFEPSVPYADLPERIARADIVLGVFGESAKAGRVIPNKVYQAMACGRPVITRASLAYPKVLTDDPHCGLVFVPPGRSGPLMRAVADLAAHPGRLPVLGQRALAAYEQWYSADRIAHELQAALRVMGARPVQPVG